MKRGDGLLGTVTPPLGAAPSVGGDVARLSRLFAFGISLRNPGCFLLGCWQQAK